jgi:hypothetical protein
MSTVYAIESGNFEETMATRYGGVISDQRNHDTFITPLAQGTTYNAAWHGKVFTNVYIYRPLLSFDLSGEIGTVTSADIKLTSNADLASFSSQLTQGSTHICKINPSSTTWVVGDMDSLDGWVSSGTYSGNVTEYATAFTNVESTTHTVALNSGAISDINSAIGSGKFHLALLTSADFTYDTGTDGLGDPPGSGFANFAGASFKVLADTTASNRPQIELTYGSATPEHNSIIFGANF